jgi:hypothetical protein
MLKTFMVVCLVACGVPQLLSAQTLSYTGTVLVHGYPDDNGRWLNQHASGSAIDRYNAAVDLKSTSVPVLNNDSSMKFQANGQLRPLLNSGRRVLVGVSFGGLVSRYAYRADTSGIAAIVTIATPHQGTYGANNSTYFGTYLLVLLTHARNMAGWTTGALLGPIGAQYVVNYVDNQLTPFKTQITSQFQSRIPQNEAKVGSAKIDTLQSFNGDAARQLPRAQVWGTLPAIKHFPLRVLGSANDGVPGAYSFSQLVEARNKVLSFAKKCKVVLFMTIVHTAKAIECSATATMLERLDHVFLAWTTGQSYNNTQVRDFDGLVEASRANYPGLTDPLRKFHVSNTDHVSIVWDVQGSQQIVQAMTSVGMIAR